jgi:hypothetical protein
MSKFFPLFFVSCLTLTACGSARITQRSVHGGQVVLSGSYMDSMSKARLRIAESCGGTFVANDFEHGLQFVCSAARDVEPPVAVVTHLASK